LKRDRGSKCTSLLLLLGLPISRFFLEACVCFIIRILPFHSICRLSPI
jgi:hypothetical protein